MTIEEIRVKVANATNFDWYTSVEVIFKFHYVRIEKKIFGFTSIFEYVSMQVHQWSKMGENLPEPFSSSKEYFYKIQQELEKFINTFYNQSYQNLDNHFSNIRSIISNTNNYPLDYDLPEVNFLINVHAEFPQSLTGAFHYITGRGNNVSFEKNYFSGLVMAYEFTMKDHTHIIERRHSEKKSLNSIRNKFQTYLTKLEQELLIHLQKNTEQITENIEKIEKLKEVKESLFNNWLIKTQNEFNSFSQNSNNKISDLENAYEELLRLKKPAEYWSQRAIELKKEGSKYLCWLMIFIAIGCTSLYTLLWLTPDGMLKSFFNSDKSLSIRWSIVFITFLSFLFLAIRTLIKITFSSFHLSRDAEERERLTYVYLAMIKDASIEKEDRHLIMQSLFSRADTGLLKEDSSPTMPNAIGMFDRSTSYK